jgi:hypothetical protein
LYVPADFVVVAIYFLFCCPLSSFILVIIFHQLHWSS